MNDHYSNAARLAIIAERIGFTLWQLQELEGVAAQYLFLRTKAKKGMGAAAGNILVEKAKNKTFGFTLREISNAGLFEEKLQSRFDALLGERNWLVHNSRASSRTAVYEEAVANSVLQRLDAVASEALALLREIDSLVGTFVKTTWNQSTTNRRRDSQDSSPMDKFEYNLTFSSSGKNSAPPNRQLDNALSFETYH